MTGARWRTVVALVCWACAGPVVARPGAVLTSEAASPVAPAPLARHRLAAGTPIALETAEPLSSKTHAKGDMIRLRIAAAVRAGDAVLIAAGAPATGQVIDAQAKGAMGMSGRLVIAPLYLQAGGRTVRLAGGATRQARVEAGAVAGLVLLTPGFTGRSATIAVGTPVAATVLREVEIDAVQRLAGHAPGLAFARAVVQTGGRAPRVGAPAPGHPRKPEPCRSPRRSPKASAANMR